MKRTPLKRTTRLRPKRVKDKVDRIPLAIPRPGEMKKEQVAVRVMADGREVCNILCKAGMDEYMRRIRAMWERQNKRCCLEAFVSSCPGRLALADATYEHQDGRGHGGGHRDDRIEKDGKPYNGAAHRLCNSLKASRRIDYNEIVP